MRLDAIAATALCCAVCCNLKNSSIKEVSEKYTSYGSSDYIRGMGELKMQTKWDSACNFQLLLVLLSIYLLLTEITWNINLQLPTWAKII